MTTNFKDYDTKHCDHCKNRKTDKCGKCMSAKGYIARPSMFEPVGDVERLYFKALEEYSKMLFRMGFEIER